MINEIIYFDGMALLRRTIVEANDLSRADKAFVDWLLSNELSLCNDDLLRDAIQDLDNHHYHDLATVGFHWERCQLLRNRFESTWHSNATRLFGRSASHQDALMSFCTDSIALLGIAIGVTKLEDDVLWQKFGSWILTFREQVKEIKATPDWSRVILDIVSDLKNEDSVKTVSWHASDPAILLALKSKNLFGRVEATESDSASIIRRVRNGNANNEDAVTSAFLIAASNSVNSSSPVFSPKSVSVVEVCDLLRQVPFAFKRWCWESRKRSQRSGEPRKWQIDNEYHVQDFLYFLLRPIFPDIKDEETFPSVGHKHPRTDLYIPSMKLIIEVKFIYNSTTFPNVTEQLGADAALYLAEDSVYKKIIAFVWDDSRRVEEHSLLVGGLRTINGIVDAVVVSRPGKMIQPESQ